MQQRFLLVIGHVEDHVKRMKNPCAVARMIIALAFILIALMPLALSAAEADKEDAVFSGKLIGAIENADYQNFIADGTDAFKTLTKEQFDAVSAKLGDHLKNRSALTYLGDLKQQGFHVTLWKLSFKGGGDDALVTMSVKEGKVGGFFIK